LRLGARTTENGGGSCKDREPKVFGWVSGDEQELLRKHGIL
jgi:hypothetical protein